MKARDLIEKLELSIDDIGYSDKVVCIGVTPTDNQY